MTASKSLPARPSLESLRKQAKKLARDIAAGDAGAIARARVHLSHVLGREAAADVEALDRHLGLLQHLAADLQRLAVGAGDQALRADMSQPSLVSTRSILVPAAVRSNSNPDRLSK